MDKIGSAQKTLHLLLVLGENHSGNGIVAGLGETPRVWSDFVTEKSGNISAISAISAMQRSRTIRSLAAAST